MPELKALAREHRLRGYSRLRKAELIELLQDNEPQAPRRPHPNRPPPPTPQRRTVPARWMSTWEPNQPPQMSTWELQREPQTKVRQPELEAPLTKRQLKHKQNKDSKLAKKFVSLDAEISNLKSQMDTLKDRIMRASKSTKAGFKRKKIRSMKREADKINEKLRESEKKLELVEPRVPKDPISGVPLKLHPLNRSKRIETTIAKLNKKIRRAKNRRNKERLIAKREALRAQLNWGPRQLDGAFGGAYRHYRIDGMPGMEPDTFFSRVRRFLIDLMAKESRTGAVCSQATAWVRFRKDGEMVELAFSSRMLNVYNLSNMNEIMNAMITHMKQQIENPALSDSKFVFDEVIHMDVDFHRLNLMRGSSYLPLPEWLACKKAIINPHNEDLECFKWAVIAATRWEEIDSHPK